MDIRVKVKTEKEMVLTDYYLMRAIKDTGGLKTVIDEKRCERPPGPDEIADFISKTYCDFASVVRNYELCDPAEPRLPFD